MLTTLRIKNLALVMDLTVELRPGFNVITGETGAGKSMLIGALDLLLGQRADRTSIRAGTESCTVEGVFETGKVAKEVGEFLDASGLEPCEDGRLFIKRTFTAAGANRQFINGSPASLNALAELGEFLVDIHGPHEHQSLLHASRQLLILDAFGKLDTEREAFAELVRRRATLQAQKAELIVDERTYAQQLDLLRFQANEIEAAKLQSGEEERVEHEFRLASNAAKLLELCQSGLSLLRDNENALIDQAGQLGRMLQELRKIDPTAEALTNSHGQALSLLQDLERDLNDFADRVNVEPGHLEAIEERLDLIHSLKRKYGADIDAVNAFGLEARKKLEMLEGRDAEVARLNRELEACEAQLWRAGQALSAKRRKLLPTLSKAVSRQLADLGFRQGRFEAALSSVNEEEYKRDPGRANLSGFDTIEFQFAPNPGEPSRPLRVIASSGELARVMLALKTVLAAEDRIPVLVFDEVDANVGGETAHAVGEKMRQISKNRQVLCITHLPQVAAPAAAHYLASKQVKGGRTTSEVKLLEPAERVTELARMLGGQTEVARRHAEALLRPPG